MNLFNLFAKRHPVNAKIPTVSMADILSELHRTSRRVDAMAPVLRETEILAGRLKAGLNQETRFSEGLVDMIARLRERVDGLEATLGLHDVILQEIAKKLPQPEMSVDEALDAMAEGSPAMAARVRAYRAKRAEL